MDQHQDAPLDEAIPRNALPSAGPNRQPSLPRTTHYRICLETGALAPHGWPVRTKGTTPPVQGANQNATALHGTAVGLCKPFARMLVLALALCSGARGVEPGPTDPYEHYVLTSKDFRAVKQDKAWCYAAFPSWTYMPWTYQWTIGYTTAAGRWSLAHGYNGAFVDHGDVSLGRSPTGRLDWINRFHLRFYTDHTASKGYLHLWDGDAVRPHLAELHAGGIRTVPANAALFRKLQGLMREHINAVKSSPYRAAYALDDEASWGHFVHPTMWCVTRRPHRLSAVAPGNLRSPAPARDRWITYEDIRPEAR